MSAHDNPAQISLIDGSSAKYCVDANVFYDFWIPDRKFRIDVYRDLWEHLSTQISGGIITSTEEVYRELKDFNNVEFQKWLSAHKDYLYVEDDLQVIKLAAEIINNNPKILFNKDKKNGGDPFLVAAAKIYDLIVITEEIEESEANIRNGACPKIPNLCKEAGVKDCFNLLGYCEKEGIKLAPTFS